MDTFQDKQVVIGFYEAGARGDMAAGFALIGEVTEYMDTALVDAVSASTVGYRHAH